MCASHDTLKTAFTVPCELVTSLEKGSTVAGTRDLPHRKAANSGTPLVSAELRLRSPDTFSLQWWGLNPGALHVEHHLSPKTDLGTRKLLISKYKFMLVGSEFKLHH